MVTREFKKGIRVRYVPNHVDEKWQQRKKIWDACMDACIEPPQEVQKFFDFKEPDKAGMSHPDIQYGCVKSTNDKYVFVLYDCAACKMLSGDEPYTAQATAPYNLEFV